MDRTYEILEVGLNQDAAAFKPGKLSDAAAKAIGRGHNLKCILDTYIAGHVNANLGYAGGVAAIDALEAPKQPAPVKHPV